MMVKASHLRLAPELQVTVNGVQAVNAERALEAVTAVRVATSHGHKA